MFKHSYLAFLMLLLVAIAANAKVPQLINYQGMLTAESGTPINGNLTIMFSIYNSATGGTAQWSESQSVTLTEGLFSVLLGSVTPIPYSLFDGNDKYLALKVGSDPEMTPRKRLVSIGYSYRANDADKLDGKSATAFVQQLDGVSANSSGNIDLEAGNNVTITPNTGSNKITISASASGGGDNLGDHTATENIKLQGHWLSGDGGDEGIYITDGGNVGIGKMSPTQKLEVQGTGQTYIRTIGDAGATGTVGHQFNSGSRNWTIGAKGSNENGAFMIYDGTVDQRRVTIDSSGNFGIGTNHPQAPLDLGAIKLDKGKGDAGVGSDILMTSAGLIAAEHSLYLNADSDNDEVGNIYFCKGAETSSATKLMTITNEGKVGIGVTQPDEKLTIRGNILVKSENTGDTVAEIGEGLDYAEGFNVTDKSKMDPGTVLIIDTHNPGKLTKCNMAYDYRVAGIIAGANGLGSGVKLGSGKFDYDVALAGRVYCNVDASYGEVAPGDLLTTSSTPGHAMVVKDYSKAQGSILGKAMEKLSFGEKKQILVLVTLQ
ncbi:hypothetical protein JXJ21_16440 [candidate division KSB1 bacterium]|nr:hypothetical protein [candidate division KSB1 bacterium]